MEVTKEKTMKTVDPDENMIIETTEELEIVKSFDDLSLREDLLRGKY